LVLWTSGTTAQPKGVVHTHQSLRHEADSLGAAHAFTDADRQLLPMPMTHVAGFTYGVLMPVCLGVPAVLMDVWDPGEALRIVAPHSGVDLFDGTAGELWTRGPEMFSGYLDPDLDAAAFASDGWFRTGDLATYVGGYLTIVDRLKDIVIRGGENISAAEVE